MDKLLANILRDCPIGMGFAVSPDNLDEIGGIDRLRWALNESPHFFLPILEPATGNLFLFRMGDGETMETALNKLVPPEPAKEPETPAALFDPPRQTLGVR